MDTAELKYQARQAIRESKPSIHTFTLIFLSILLLLTLLASKVTSADIGMSEDELAKVYEQYSQYYYEGNVEGAYGILSRFMPSEKASLINLAIDLVSVILGAGYLIFVFHTVRRTGQASYGNVLDGFGIAIKYLLIKLIKAVVLLVTLFALVVPHIVLAYSYRQAEFLLIDHPDWGIFRCLKESRMMMRGRKTELFRIDMSLLGWYVLEVIASSSVVFTFLNIIAKPITECTKVVYYDRIKPVEVYAEI